MPAHIENPKTKTTWTVGELLDWTAKFLAEKGSESPRLDTEVLLAEALGCRRIELYTRHTEAVAEEPRQRFRELIRRRVEGCPVAYLVGRKEFFSLTLDISPAVLIPRPESEFVVMECLRLTENMPAPTVLDLGTGSGNLAVTIAHRHKNARVTAVDISPDALQIAAKNAVKHGVADRITFREGDLFSPLPSGSRFDGIVSNPPYIVRDEIARLAPGVRDYEPHLALDGGPDGFAIFDRIVTGAGDFLQPGGYLIIEIGAPQEKYAREKIANHGGYELAATIQDYSGHPRVVCGRWRG